MKLNQIPSAIIRMSRIIKLYGILVGILFALSPCVSKASLWQAAELAYEKPINKSKTHLPSFSCELIQGEKKDSVSRFVELDFSFVFHEGATHSVYHHPRWFVGKLPNLPQIVSSSPPLYILLRRLKIHLA
ncbi:hypothetical protein [Pleomorphovibrio marinus]|uniref:hypothetical protein n=1 Tax=Pleomorphovibrio marinus TaxID=2164132 RepID=UPI001300AABB|nr:hypothetical protein [Pleomorphovibrio marinus]